MWNGDCPLSLVVKNWLSNYMSDMAIYGIETMADARQETIFFKCPVGGFASLRPGICPKCGEFLMIVGASPASMNDYTEVRVPDTARTSTNNHEAGVAG